MRLAHCNTGEAMSILDRPGVRHSFLRSSLFPLVRDVENFSVCSQRFDGPRGRRQCYVERD